MFNLIRRLIGVYIVNLMNGQRRLYGHPYEESGKRPFGISCGGAGRRLYVRSYEEAV